MNEMSLWYWMANTSVEFGATMFAAGVCVAFLYDAVVSRGVELFELVVELRAKCST